MPKRQFNEMQKQIHHCKGFSIGISKFRISRSSNSVLIKIPSHPAVTTSSKEMFLSKRYKTTLQKLSLPVLVAVVIWTIYFIYFESLSWIIEMSSFKQYFPKFKCEERPKDSNWFYIIYALFFRLQKVIFTHY